MWRVIRWLIPLALITFGVLWPLVFRGGSAAPTVSDPVVFSNYQADFVVNGDGRLDAVETITAEFPGGRHGIFRYWDVANQNSPRVRQKPEITSILLDGEPAPYQMLWEDGGFVLYRGRPSGAALSILMLVPASDPAEPANRNRLGDRQIQGALGSLHRDVLALDRYVDSGGYRNRLLTNARHLCLRCLSHYHTYARTSPPTPCLAA